MIRFSCPGCDKSFSVPDEKAGKSVKCPKCETAFTIPTAMPSVDAPTPTPASSEPVEIAPCPGCAMALTVSPDFLGADVECPGCKTVFTAIDKNKSPQPKPLAPKLAPVSKVGSSKAADSSYTRKSKRRAEDDDEEDHDRPVRRSSRRRDDEDEDEEETRPVKKKSSKRALLDDDGDDDEEDDRPVRKKKKKKQRIPEGENKRMTAALLAFFLGNLGVHKFYLGYSTAGIIMLLTCGGFGIINLIEAIIYFTKTDEEFYDTYVRNEKPWF